MSCGKVIGYVDKIYLKDAEFRVRESGRLKVLKTGQKNVHAFVIGVVAEGTYEDSNCSYVVNYNPKKNPKFVNMFSNEPVNGCYRCLVTPNGIYVKE
jgi:hypothetical protein